MQEPAAEGLRPPRPPTLAEHILIPPKFEKKQDSEGRWVDDETKPTHGKYRIQRASGNGEISITPASDWDEIHEFDEAHQIKVSHKEGKNKKKEESLSLSDFLLKNVKDLAQLATKEGFITQDDIDEEFPDIGLDENKERKIILDKDGKPAMIHPYSFLRIERGKLVIPENLTAIQRENLMLMIYSKVVNVDNSHQSEDGGVKKLLIDRITAGYQKLKNAGDVVIDSKASTQLFTDKSIFQALNIACRKAVDAKLKEEAYELTRPQRYKGERTALDNLLQRLQVAHNVGDSSKHSSAARELQGTMHAMTENKSEMEYSVMLDIAMAQAFEILVPAPVRLQMKKDQITAEQTQDYKKRAELNEKLSRQKQVWRMAILKHYQVERAFPKGSKIESIAAESENLNVFTPDEIREIAEDRKIVAEQIAKLSKRKDGLAGLNLTTMNVIKTAELLESENLIPSNPNETHDAKSKRIEDAIMNLFGLALDVAIDYSNKNHDPHAKDKLIEKSNLLNKLSGDKRESVLRIIREGFSTQMALEQQLTLSTKKKFGNVVRPTDIGFTTHMDEGIKGMELLYRRGKSGRIDEVDRYKSPDMKGKANFKLVRDRHGNEHIVALRGGELSDEEYHKAEAVMHQKAVPPATSTTHPPTSSGENHGGSSGGGTAPEHGMTPEKKNELAVKIGGILGLKDVKDADDFIKKIGEDVRVNQISDEQGKLKTRIEFTVDDMNLTSIDDLDTLRQIKEIYPNLTLVIGHLNLELNATESNDLGLNKAIEGVYIDRLELESKDPERHFNLNFEGSTIGALVVRNGEFTILADNAIETIDVDSTLNLLLSSNEVVQDFVNSKTAFRLGERSTLKISILKENNKPAEEIFESTNLPAEDRKDELFLTRFSDDKFDLITKNELDLIKNPFKFSQDRELKIGEARDIAKEKIVEAFKKLNWKVEGGQIFNTEEEVEAFLKNFDDMIIDKRRALNDTEASEFFDKLPGGEEGRPVGAYFYDVMDYGQVDGGEAALAFFDYFYAKATSEPENKRIKDMAYQLFKRTLGYKTGPAMLEEQIRLIDIHGERDNYQLSNNDRVEIKDFYGKLQDNKGDFHPDYLGILNNENDSHAQHVLQMIYDESQKLSTNPDTVIRYLFEEGFGAKRNYAIEKDGKVYRIVKIGDKSTSSESSSDSSFRINRRIVLDERAHLDPFKEFVTNPHLNGDQRGDRLMNSLIALSSTDPGEVRDAANKFLETNEYLLSVLIHSTIDPALAGQQEIVHMYDYLIGLAKRTRNPDVERLISDLTYGHLNDYDENGRYFRPDRFKDKGDFQQILARHLQMIPLAFEPGETEVIKSSIMNSLETIILEGNSAVNFETDILPVLNSKSGNEFLKMLSEKANEDDSLKGFIETAAKKGYVIVEGLGTYRLVKREEYKPNLRKHASELDLRDLHDKIRERKPLDVDDRKTTVDLLESRLQSHRPADIVASTVEALYYFDDAVKAGADIPDDVRETVDQLRNKDDIVNFRINEALNDAIQILEAVLKIKFPENPPEEVRASIPTQPPTSTPAPAAATDTSVQKQDSGPEEPNLPDRLTSTASTQPAGSVSDSSSADNVLYWLKGESGQGANEQDTSVNPNDDIPKFLRNRRTAASSTATPATSAPATTASPTPLPTTTQAPPAATPPATSVSATAQAPAPAPATQPAQQKVQQQPQSPAPAAAESTISTHREEEVVPEWEEEEPPPKAAPLGAAPPPVRETESTLTEKPHKMKSVLDD